MTNALLCALLALLAATSCRPATPPREFDGQAAFRYLETQVRFGPRIPGTAGHERMADWLDSLLRSRADTLLVQAWVHTTGKGVRLPLRNLLARFNPGAGERILFLAHWDTRPRADRDPTDSTRPVPGANDGASGVAVLLGMADALKAKPPRVGVDLLFVDGEDYGNFETEKEDVLIGSRYYARHLPPGPRPLYAVLVDMVGDRDLTIKQEGQSLLAAPEVVDLVWSEARKLGYAQYFVPTPGPTLTDDHVELIKVGIRAIDVVDFEYGGPDNRYWHTRADSLDKVSAASLQVVGDVMMALVRRAER
ncbi:MAG TPA: M28 family peptidase [Gemmatimonadales bacterium]|nr:M28 family peptidase [Gemmatimonadales bacterium]